MKHWIILPILLPLFCGALLILFSRWGLMLQRTLSVITIVALLALSGWLFYSAANGDYQTYALGNWPAPYGIVLVLDRLSALMLMLTALVSVFSVWYALHGTDARGRYFHALWQFQLLGLNGAFLTGDLFNLFVFFEILLIASYGLLLHGGGAARIRAGLHYVILNLVGSAFFLFAVGTLYGITGTLNMADLAVKIANAPADNTALLHAGALLLLVVFALKAALLPLYFWLPSAYSSTSAPVAALFAIMTKVGVYAILRVFTLTFGPMAGETANIAVPWLLPLALATLVAGTFGALASRDLRTLLAYFVLVSIGTLLTGVGLFSSQALSAALLYLIHTTLITAGMFLLADVISLQRGDVNEYAKPPVAQPLLLGLLFFTGAIAMAGMPPLSGFLGKLMILLAAHEHPALAWVWSILLSTSLLGIIAFSRMGSALFWRTSGYTPTGEPMPLKHLTPVILLLVCSPLLVILSGPVTSFTAATARQLLHPADYLESVLGSQTLDVNDANLKDTP